MQNGILSNWKFVLGVNGNGLTMMLNKWKMGLVSAKTAENQLHYTIKIT
jgi:hypothetical protein